ncbi:VTT domain-containing protein [Neobacillus sp. SM06]|uniref:VTT domain-containing protein n=1 Tax=Neobacillus sp. SM06 TaxID=3422492 RepID=UPI003D2C17EF
MNMLIQLLDQYGYIVLFFSLMLELIIIPIPNEILMSYVGFLVYQGKLNYYLTILFGGLGGIIGVSISYWIGYKLGAPFFEKYGSKIHMGPEKIAKISRWNERFGKRLLVFSYFIPGVRHITSLFSGITRIPFKSYALFAYIGVFFWVGTFISLGRIFGPQWEKFHQQANLYIVIAILVLGGGYIVYFLIKTNRQKLSENAVLLFENFFKRFNSFLKIKLIVFAMALVFIALFSLMIGLIQDFIENEFGQFNTIAKTVILYSFNGTWKNSMLMFNQLTSWVTFVVVGILAVIWILFKGKNKWLEIQYFIIAMLGAVTFGKGLNFLFSFIPTAKPISKSFPNDQALIAIVLFIFFMYVIIRHSRSTFMNSIMALVILFFLLFLFISKVYLNLQYPSDLTAGYVFGGVWVSLIILLIEGSRLLNLIKAEIKKEKR